MRFKQTIPSICVQKWDRLDSSFSRICIAYLIGVHHVYYVGKQAMQNAHILQAAQ